MFMAFLDMRSSGRTEDLKKKSKQLKAELKFTIRDDFPFDLQPIGLQNLMFRLIFDICNELLL